MYRPDGWKNPYPENIMDRWSEEAFEAGADAMLEALRNKDVFPKSKAEFLKRGKTVFIPGEE